MQIIFSITVCNAIYPRSICILCPEIPLNAFCHHFIWLSCTGTICRVFCVCSICIYFNETDLMQFVCASGSAVYFSPITVAVTKTFYPLPICVLSAFVTTKLYICLPIYIGLLLLLILSASLCTFWDNY